MIGRFLSVDPVTAYSNLIGAFNRYWYAAGNPYKFTDPDGRDVTCSENRCTVRSHTVFEALVDWGTVGVIYARRLLENAIVNAQQSESNEGGSNESSSPSLPEDLVGEQDGKGGRQGGRINSGPLTPENGGTGNSESDFDHLTGGDSSPAPEGGRLPEGSRVGENGVIHRPGNGSTGPRIDIPGNGTKPHETLHYPPPPPPPPEDALE